MKSVAKTPKVNIGDYFPHASKEAISFLQGCLMFNPNVRYSIEDCINHPLFKNVRRPDIEGILEKKKIYFDFEELEITE